VKFFTVRRAFGSWSGEGSKDKRYDHHLKNEYAQSDGFHLMKKAHDEALDGIVLPMINSAINDNRKE
jgi:hypothetical protein